MNNELLFFLLFGILCSASGFVVYKIYLLITAIRESKRRRREYPSLEEATADNTCKGPHSYDRIKLLMPPLPFGEYLVCKDCGFVSNDEGDYKLNGPALTVYLNNLKLIEERKLKQQALMFKKQQDLDVLMNDLIKRNIESFDGDLHKNIESLKQFFRKSIIEVDSLYAKLNDEFKDPNG